MPQKARMTISLWAPNGQIAARHTEDIKEKIITYRLGLDAYQKAIQAAEDSLLKSITVDKGRKTKEKSDVVE